MGPAVLGLLCKSWSRKWHNSLLAPNGGVVLRYRVALSFPDERLDFVSQVADKLSAALGRSSVFFYKYEESQLVRPNLDILLQRIYSNAELIIVFGCKEYSEKSWCQNEWRAIRPLIFTRERAVMVLTFDGASPPGYSPVIDGCLPIGGKRSDEIARIILDRLAGMDSSQSADLLDASRSTWLRVSPGEGAYWTSAAEKLPAHVLDPENPRLLPVDVGSVWGLDRSSYLGVITGGSSETVFSALVRTEVILWEYLRKRPEKHGLPVRWWLRMRSGISPPVTLAQIWDSVEDQASERLAYLRREVGLPMVAFGVYFDLPAKSPEIEIGLLEAWAAALARLAPTTSVALVFHLPEPAVESLLSLSGQIRRRGRQMTARIDLLQLLPQKDEEPIRESRLPEYLNDRLPKLASLFSSSPDDLQSKEAVDIIQELDEQEDRPSGVYQLLLESVRPRMPSLLIALLKAGARSSCHQGRRETLVFATQADAWMDAWLAGADLADPSAVVALAAPRDSEYGVVVDPLAVALLRRLDRVRDQGRTGVILDALLPKLSEEFHTVARVYRGELPIDDFLDSSRPGGHRLAIRAGLAPWPSRELLARLDPDRLDLWRLFAALPIDSSRIEDLLNLEDPACRAIFGLCTPDEWASIRTDPQQERLVIAARQLRPLNFP
jgi:hypothetical protein